MADQTPIKVVRSSGDSIGLAEYTSTDTVPVANGGTGATTAAGARTNLDAAPTSHTHTETVYTLTGTDVDPDNGTIQKKTLAAAYTPSFSLSSGESVTLTLLNADTYTVTWTAVSKWYGDTPADFGANLTGDDAFVIWHDGTSVCATYVGGYSA